MIQEIKETSNTLLRKSAAIKQYTIYHYVITLLEIIKA